MHAESKNQLENMQGDGEAEDDIKKNQWELIFDLLKVQHRFREGVKLLCCNKNENMV